MFAQFADALQQSKNGSVSGGHCLFLSGDLHSTTSTFTLTSHFNVSTDEEKGQDKPLTVAKVVWQVTAAGIGGR